MDIYVYSKLEDAKLYNLVYGQVCYTKCLLDGWHSHVLRPIGGGDYILHPWPEVRQCYNFLCKCHVMPEVIPKFHCDALKVAILFLFPQTAWNTHFLAPRGHGYRVVRVRLGQALFLETVCKIKATYTVYSGF